MTAAAPKRGRLPLLARLVRCAVHGPMKYDHARAAWRCVGFDGEGCTVTATDRDIEVHRPAGADYTTGQAEITEGDKTWKVR